jgi:hypothetical protein
VTVYPWPYPCPVCNGQMTVDIQIGIPKKGKTTKVLSCECGVEPVRIVGATDLEHDRVGRSPIPRERIVHYKRTTCRYCGWPLTGRQKELCSKRCNMRWIREQKR